MFLNVKISSTTVCLSHCVYPEIEKCTVRARAWIVNACFLIAVFCQNAVANVGIGIYLFESGSGCSQMGESRLTAFWVYIAYIIFTLLLQFIMFIVFAIVAANAELAGKLFRDGACWLGRGSCYGGPGQAFFDFSFHCLLCFLVCQTVASLPPALSSTSSPVRRRKRPMTWR